MFIEKNWAIKLYQYVAVIRSIYMIILSFVIVILIIFYLALLIIDAPDIRLQ